MLLAVLAAEKEGLSRVWMMMMMVVVVVVV
jgi:hypothetical protein